MEIVKRPGQTLGLYIREGNGVDRADGVFISRIALESAVYNSCCLSVGDEILAVNMVDVRRMSLDDVVIIMSIPRRLLLTTRETKYGPGHNAQMLSRPEFKPPPVVVIKQGLPEEKEYLNNGNDTDPFMHPPPVPPRTRPPRVPPEVPRHLPFRRDFPDYRKPPKPPSDDRYHYYNSRDIIRGKAPLSEQVPTVPPRTSDMRSNDLDSGMFDSYKSDRAFDRSNPYRHSDRTFDRDSISGIYGKGKENVFNQDAFDGEKTRESWYSDTSSISSFKAPSPPVITEQPKPAVQHFQPYERTYPKTLESLAEKIHSFNPSTGQPRARGSLRMERPRRAGPRGGRISRVRSDQRLPTTEQDAEDDLRSSLLGGGRKYATLQYPQTGSLRRTASGVSHYADPAVLDKIKDSRLKSLIGPGSSPASSVLRRRTPTLDYSSDTEILTTTRSSLLGYRSRGGSLPRERGGMRDQAMRDRSRLVHFGKDSSTSLTTSLGPESQEDSDGAVSAPELPVTRKDRGKFGLNPLHAYIALSSRDFEK